MDMILITLSEEKLRTINYFNTNCWDYPIEELTYLREIENKGDKRIYALTELNRIYELECTFDDLKKLF